MLRIYNYIPNILINASQNNANNIIPKKCLLGLCLPLLGEFSALTCLYVCLFGILINLLKTHSKIALRFVAHKNHVLYT